MISRPESEHRDESLIACQEQEHLLLGQLRRTLDQPSTAATRQSLLEIVARLLVHLPRHLELACRNGYLSEALRLRPNWHRQVEQLHTANLRCISTLQELHDHVERQSPAAIVATKESGALDLWIQSLTSIRGDENRLLQAAFTFDIGGEA